VRDHCPPQSHSQILLLILTHKGTSMEIEFILPSLFLVLSRDQDEPQCHFVETKVREVTLRVFGSLTLLRRLSERTLTRIKTHHRHNHHHESHQLQPLYSDESVSEQVSTSLCQQPQKLARMRTRGKSRLASLLSWSVPGHQQHQVRSTLDLLLSSLQ
jgi:hypothetical protein